jgi:hypothetical protein
VVEIRAGVPFGARTTATKAKWRVVRAHRRPLAGMNRHRRRTIVSNHVYKKLELTGTSATGVDDAIRSAIAKAGKTVHNLRWFEVAEIRGGIEGGTVANWQVTIKVGFTLDD